MRSGHIFRKQMAEASSASIGPLSHEPQRGVFDASLGEGSAGGIRAVGPFRLTCHQVSNTSQIHSFGPKRCVRLRRLALCSSHKSEGWWAWVDSNYRPHAYQACALTRLSYRPVDPQALDHIAPVLSKPDRTTRTLAPPDLTAGDTTSGPCPNMAKNQIDLSSRKLPGPSLSKKAKRRNRTPGASRKEVIQPQVLLQLPCYDFTPITNHTLGACFPCRLARRLLVQPAFVM